ARSLKVIHQETTGDSLMPLRFSIKWLLFAAFIASGAAYGQEGPITYVDAMHGDDGNTRRASGEEFIPHVDPSAENHSPWQLQAFGNEGSAYGVEEGTVADALDAALLVTTLTGLTSGDRYNVFAYFWTDRPGGRIEASLKPPAASGIGVPAVTPPGSRE